MRALKIIHISFNCVRTITMCVGEHAGVTLLCTKGKSATPTPNPYVYGALGSVYLYYNICKHFLLFEKTLR